MLLHPLAALRLLLLIMKRYKTENVRLFEQRVVSSCHLEFGSIACQMLELGIAV